MPASSASARASRGCCGAVFGGGFFYSRRFFTAPAYFSVLNDREQSYSKVHDHAHQERIVNSHVGEKNETGEERAGYRAESVQPV